MRKQVKKAKFRKGQVVMWAEREPRIIVKKWHGDFWELGPDKYKRSHQIASERHLRPLTARERGSK